MQERLHIDEIKRVEKMVTTLLKSWQKLNKEHNQLSKQYAALNEEFATFREQHDNQIGILKLAAEQAEKSAGQALSRAVQEENQRWQEKYDQACSAHEEKVQEMYKSHQQALGELREQMQAQEKALSDELAQVKKVKEVLSNRVLGVVE